VPAHPTAQAVVPPWPIYRRHPVQFLKSVDKAKVEKAD